MGERRKRTFTSILLWVLKPFCLVALLGALLLVSYKIIDQSLPQKFFQSYFQAKIRNLINDEINPDIRGHLSFETATYVFPTSFRFTNAILKDKSGQIVVRAPFVRFSFSMFSLLTGVPTISSGIITRPYVNLVHLSGKDQNGELNLVAIFDKPTAPNKSTQPQKKLEINIQNISLESADLNYKISEKFRFELSGLSLDSALFIAGKDTKYTIFNAISQKGFLITSKERLALSKIEILNFRVQDEILFSDQLKLKSRKYSLELSGSYDLEKKLLDIEAEGEASIEKVNSKLIFKNFVLRGPAANPKINTAVKTCSQVYADNKKCSQFDFQASIHNLNDELSNTVLDLKAESKTLAAISNGFLSEGSLAGRFYFDGLNKITVESLQAKANEFDLSGEGRIIDDKLSSQISLKASRIDRSLLDTFPKARMKDRLNIDFAVFTGNVSGKIPNLKFKGHVSGENIAFGKYLFSELSSNLSYSSDKLQVDGLSVNYFLGGILLAGSISNLLLSPVFELDFNIQNFPLLRIEAPIVSNLVSGQLSLRGQIRGDLDNLVLTGLATIPNLITKQMPFGYVSTKFVFKDKRLKLSSLFIDGPSTSLQIASLKYQLEEKSLFAIGKVSRLDLKRLGILRDSRLAGQAMGKFTFVYKAGISDLKADLHLDDIKYRKVHLGSGAAKMSYSGSQLQVSVGLKSDLEQIIWGQAAIDFSQQPRLILANLDFEKLNILPWSQLKSSLTLPIGGNVNGNVQVSGKLENPDISLRLISNNLQARSTRLESLEPLIVSDFDKNIGYFYLDFEYKNQVLSLDFCDNQSKRVSNCFGNEKLYVNLRGTSSEPKFWEKSSEYALKLKSNFTSGDLNHILKVLQENISQSDLRLGLVGDISKKSGQEKPDYDLNLSVERLKFSSPSFGDVSLLHTTKINLKNDYIGIAAPARLKVSNGQLLIAGHFSKKDMGLKLSGEIPMFFLKFLLPQILSSQGLMVGKLELRGSLQAPLIEGTLMPKKNASLAFTKYINPVKFREGQLSLFVENGKTTIQAKQVSVVVGEGSVNLNGNATIGRIGTLTNLNFKSVGKDVFLKFKNAWVETSFELETKLKNNKPVLAGKLKVLDGKIVSKFKLNDFTISTSSSMPILEEDHILSPFELDVGLEVQSLNYAADVEFFRIESELASDLMIGGVFGNPRLSGRLDLNAGILQFPGSKLEIQPTHISLENSLLRRINPEIKLDALGTIFQANSTARENIQIIASVQGYLREAHLELSASSISKYFDSAQTLLMLLRPGLIGSMKSTESILSVSGNILSSPLTSKIGDFISELSDTNIKFSAFLQKEGLASQVQWQIGPRLEFEGVANTSSSSMNISNFKVNFLLFDHLPFGEKLSLEGYFISEEPDSDIKDSYNKIRLKYRLLER